MSLPITWEGMLGASRQCDICLPVDRVASRHADYEFRSGTGLILVPRHHQTLNIDGESIRNRRDAIAHPMQHGSVVEVGSARLVFRAFKGLGAERRSVLADADTSADKTASVPAQIQDEKAVADESAAAVPVWDTWFVDQDPQPDYTIPTVSQALPGCIPSDTVPENGSFAAGQYAGTGPEPQTDIVLPEAQPAVNPYARPSAKAFARENGNPYARPVAPADAALSAYRHRRQMRKEAPNGQDEA